MTFSHLNRLAHRPPAHRRRSPSDGRAALLATAAYLGLGWRYHKRNIGHTEGGLFAGFNHASRDGLIFLRLPQQLGTPWVLPLLSVVGFATRRPHLAVSAAVALPLEKGMEVGVKKLLHRPRPAQLDHSSVLHDDAPEDGPSYPSGHAAIAFAAVTLSAPYLTTTSRAAALMAASSTAMVRVHQGAHFPGDALGGALLGLAVGRTLRSIFGTSSA